MIIFGRVNQYSVFAHCLLARIKWLIIPIIAPKGKVAKSSNFLSQISRIWLAFTKFRTSLDRSFSRWPSRIDPSQGLIQMCTAESIYIYIISLPQNNIYYIGPLRYLRTLKPRCHNVTKITSVSDVCMMLWGRHFLTFAQRYFVTFTRHFHNL
jgi:hypothetical protein